MNEKQKLFCRYYIETNDEKLSAINAGYMEQTGAKLLKNEKIKKYIDENSNNNVAKSNEIIECLTRIMRGEEYSFENEKSTKGVSIRERLKAAELLGKMYSIFSPKQEQTNEEPIYILGNDFIKE